MKVLVLAALLVAVSSGPLSGDRQNPSRWPWQVGKLYRYDVSFQTLSRLDEGASAGSVFKANLIIRVKTPDRLNVKLEAPQHALINQQVQQDRPPSDLKFQPVKNIDVPFEIVVNGGRIESLNLPSSMPLAEENLIKGLISTIQIDLSAERLVDGPQNYDKISQQGLFTKIETDVTGDCETQYTVSPVTSEWRRELPKFAKDEDPIEIKKSKNYGHCHHRVSYHFGVPEGAEWTGTAHNTWEDQFMIRTTNSRLLVSKQGLIYKAETNGAVHVHPYMFGKQKAEVLSKVTFNLLSFEQDSETQWQMPGGSRFVKDLLYALSSKKVVAKEPTLESINSQVQPQNLSKKNRRSITSSEPTMEGYRNKKHGVLSEASSTSSDSSSAYTNDEELNLNEPAYAALYMHPQSRFDKQQNPANALKVLQDIAQQLQNINNMPEADVLSKFNILVRILASMNSEQLQQTSHSVEVAQFSNENVKSDMWMVYRDAVTQAGTLPAFKQIQIWIHAKKIREEEAAEVVTSLANTLRYPTKEVMIQFFNLAWSHDVNEQKYLNTSCLLAATKLINKAQVNNETAHSYYPTHMYGRLARKYDRFVINAVMPRFQERLRQIIEAGDSSKAQVYIKAIENLGHRRILDVFAPYLEGKIPVSTYLRVRMIRGLKVLAMQRDQYARAVLYSILRNTAEPYEVRVACIDTIFLCPPTPAMMQAMAQMTHDDPSIEVRSVLKSSIESAAKLTVPRFWELARTAQTALPMVSRKNFGSHYSSMYFTDSFNSDNEVGMMGLFTFIGSKDSLFPKQFKALIRNQQTGWNIRNSISGSISSIPQFLDYMLQGIVNQRDMNIKSEINHKFSAEKIDEIFNIKRRSENSLEASISIDLINQQRFFAVSEEDMRKWPSVLQEQLSNLAKGIDIHYTKVLNVDQVSVMFPTVTGMPFIFKYKVPKLINIQGNIKGHVNFPTKENREFGASMENEIQLTVARNLDGNVGFLDTIVNKHVCAGFISKFQLTIPVKSEMRINSGHIKINLHPLRPNQDTNLIHFSVWPYTASQNKDSLTPLSQDPNSKLVSRLNKINSIDTKFGEETGAVFQVQGYSHSLDYRNIGNMIEGRDLLSVIVDPLRQKDIAETHYTLRYLGKQSQSQGLTLNAVYDKSYYEPQSVLVQETSEISDIKDVSPNSQERRKEVIKRAVSGINKPRAQVIDLSAIFEGHQKLEYVCTAAVGESLVDTKVRYAVFAGRNSDKHGNNQVNSVGSVTWPAIPTVNFLEVLKMDLKTNFYAEIKFDQNIKTNLKINGVAERKEALKLDSWEKQCLEQMSQNNYYQPACRKMMMMARTLDHIKASIAYNDVGTFYKNMTYKAFRIAQHLGFWDSDLNVQKTAPEGRLDIEIQNSSLNKTINLWLNSRVGNVRFDNVRLPRILIPALSIKNHFKLSEQVLNHFTAEQFLPFCIVDGGMVKTFSNRTYDFRPTQSWYVVMQDDAKYAGKQGINTEQLVVLAKRSSDKNLETYISFKSNSGKDIEINILQAPESSKTNINVVSNAKKALEGDLTSYWDDVLKMPLLEYYVRPDGVLAVEILENRLRILHDGQRLFILANNNRNNTVGLCGAMSGEPRDDFVTPFGIVDKPEQYTSSFALENKSSDSQDQQLQTQVQQHAYERKLKYTKILLSDPQWRTSMQASSSSSSSSSSEEESSGSPNIYRTKSYRKLQGTCEIQQQVQYYENHGEICITTTPVESCQVECRGVDYKIQNAQVVCRPRLDEQFIAFRDQIRQGQDPSVTGYPHVRQFRVPGACQA